jgi:LL-diaminopimelate aminotransferase
MTDAMITPSRFVETLPGYPLAKLPGIKRMLLEKGMDVIDLGAGDADYPPPAIAVDALSEALENPAFSKYGFQQGLPEFRRAAAAWIARRFGHRFDPATELLPLIGSKEGLAHLPFTVINPGDVAVIPEPGYQAYLGGTILAGGTPYVYPLTPRTNFLLELGEVPEETLRRTKLVFLNYPNNPTAAIAPMEYLERVVEICRRYGILLAYDNAYCEIGFDGYRAPSIFDIPGARDVAVEFFSLSKSFSMTGWRLGWAVGRPELIAPLTKIKSYVDTGPFLAIQKAGVAVLEQAETLVQPVVAELQERRDTTVAALQDAGFALERPRAAMYLWVPLPGDEPSADFAHRALFDEGVIVLPGSSFGKGGEGFFRIALTMPAERLREAVQRLSRVRSARGRAPLAATA